MRGWEGETFTTTTHMNRRPRSQIPSPLTQKPRMNSGCGGRSSFSASAKRWFLILLFTWGMMVSLTRLLGRVFCAGWRRERGFWGPCGGFTRCLSPSLTDFAYFAAQYHRSFTIHSSPALAPPPGTQGARSLAPQLNQRSGKEVFAQR